MKNRLLILLIAALVCRQLTLAQGIQLEIGMEKNVFLEGESIYLFATLRNNGKEGYDYQLFHMGSGTLRITAKSASGIPSFYQGGLYHYGSTPRRYTLRAGESTEEFINLSWFYPRYRSKYGLAKPFHSMYPVGTYTVQAVFENNHDTLVSNIVTFEVAEPSTSEKAPHDELKRIFTELYVKNRKEIFASEMEKYLSRFPRSVFTPLAKMELSYALERMDQKRATEHMLGVIKDFGDRAYAAEALVTVKVSEAEKLKVSEEVAKESKSKHVRDYARYFSKKMKKRE